MVKTMNPDTAALKAANAIEASLSRDWHPGQRKAFIQATIVETMREVTSKPDPAIAELERQIEELHGWDEVWRDRVDAAETTVARLAEMLEAAADQCDRWAEESRSGGWSTHQVTANRKLASTLRAALSAEQPKESHDA